jgi:hypothetical protein
MLQVVAYGLNHPTGSFIEGEAVTVKDLLKDLYERSCHQKNWALVRHTAGTHATAKFQQYGVFCFINFSD